MTSVHTTMQAGDGNYLALDVGHVRVGVAYANSIARLPRPLTTLAHNETLWGSLDTIITEEQIGYVIVGLPRNLQGDDTAQTVSARAFADEVQKRYHVTVVLQDEALTSRKAEDELAANRKPHAKGAIDALAATYILEDYLAN